MKTNCETCWNKIMDDYCSRMMDMQKAQYRKCDGWKEIPEKPKKIISTKTKDYLSIREERLLAKHDVGDDFRSFLLKGGHWSFNEAFINQNRKI